jgi:hypothetical protein
LLILCKTQLYFRNKYFHLKLTEICTHGEDPAVLDEGMVSEAVGEDLAAVSEAVGGQGGVEVDAVEEQACDVDPMAVREAWRRTRRAVKERACGWRGNDSSSGLGLGATHLKRRIVAMSGVDYVSTPISTDG